MKYGERSDGTRETVDGKHEIKERYDCFRQLFRRDFPLSVGSFVLMGSFFFSAVLPQCSRKLAPVLRRGGVGVLDAHAGRSRMLWIPSWSGLCFL